MLSITLPTISEKITLNGVEVEVYPLPLFFSDRLHRVFPAPDESDKSATAALYYTRRMAVKIVEALRLSEEVQHNGIQGRPAWDDSAKWPLYAAACVDALEAAGFSNAHVSAVHDALDALEARQLEALEPVGNS